ncbi:MAG: HypC/HybG/HupF family hydrogenase formation chaperone [Bacilli bacterium]
MCLAVPGEVLDIDGSMALVDMAGVRRRVCIDLLDEVHPGDYVLVHVGFALQIIDEREAQETLELLRACFQEDLRAAGAPSTE